MEPETLIFMPNGDVTLTLIRNVLKEEDNASSTTLVPSHVSTQEQSVTDVDEPRESQVEAEAQTPAEQQERIVYFAPDPPGGADGPFYPPPPRAARGSDASSRRERSASPPASFWASLRRKAAAASEASDDEDDLPVNQPSSTKQPERIILSSHEVHCVVSSRHMMLASNFFHLLLGGNSEQAITLRSRGHVTISLDADLDAMIVLLNIVHGASRKVPRQVSLDLLTKLAILVRGFSMLETVQFFSDTWIENFLRDGLPKSYNEDVLPLLFVFWVFDRSTEFRDMTRLAQRQTDEKFEEDAGDVPIPRSILDAISRSRQTAIDAAISLVHTLIAKYMGGDLLCDATLDAGLRYACDAMVLGSLMKSANNMGIWPKPEAPLYGKKFRELARAIRRTKILDVCNKSSNRRWNSLGPPSNAHGLEDSIEASIQAIEATIDGLELSNYLEKKELSPASSRAFLLLPTKDEPKGQPHKTIEKNDPLIATSPLITETAKEDAKAPHRHSSASEFVFFPHATSRETDAPAQRESKSSLGRYSGEFQPSPELQRSTSLNGREPRALAKDEGRSRPGGTSQETPIISKQGAKPANSPSPLQQEWKPATSEETKALADRKLKRTTSHPRIPLDNVKSPMYETQSTPKVPSIEEMIEDAPQPEKDRTRDLVNQAAPSAPIVPGVPSAPNVPTVPSAPRVPSAPNTPNAPNVPTVPSAPRVPSAPNAPNVPIVPSGPSAPNAPRVPSATNVPAVPSGTNAPSAPRVPSAPTAPIVPTAAITPVAPIAPAAPVTAAAPVAPARLSPNETPHAVEDQEAWNPLPNLKIKKTKMRFATKF